VRHAGLAGFCLVAAGCAHLEVGRSPPDLPPERTEPVVRVALLTGGDTLRVGGGAALRLTDGQGHSLADLPQGRSVLVRRAAGGLSVAGGSGATTPGPIELIPVTPDAPVRVAGRDYRGLVRIDATGTGLLAINRVGLESYVAGVVNAEMGRRVPGEEAALEAQAILSRTYALTAIGRPGPRAWDVLATTADQVYLGLQAETGMGWHAVEATRGTILTFGGRPIEAFFHSTCGGRTAAGDEVFRNGALPYLPSVSDLGPGGQSWCARSPRYRWREEWTAERLRSILAGSLPPRGVHPGEIADVVDVTVTGHTASARVAGLRIRLAGRTVPVDGSPAVREVLQPEPGQVLRSAAFEIVVTPAGGRLARIVLDGRGAGHGVGMCQWGAIGRARAGASAARILGAYFPGTRLERRW
jgi:stage II sporulation protein D